MGRKKRILRLVCLILTGVLLCGALGTEKAAAINWNASFSDVSSDAWYYDYVMECAKFEIVDGYSDGTFRPDVELKRGEFLKMLACSIEDTYSTTKLKGVHWAEYYWNVLNELGVLDWKVSASTDASGGLVETSRPIFSCTFAELEKPISRYEMAHLIDGVLFTVDGENTVELTDAADHIGDYNVISLSYKSAVEQAYGKGILAGIDDKGSFGGDYTLTRAQAAKAIVCLLEPGKRAVVSFAKEVTPTYEPADSFAWQYRNMTTSERRLALFGDANKTHFTSASDAGSRVIAVQVKTWDLNSSGGKYTRTWTIYVNAMVADEVKAIFTDIYNDPEKFPIHALGGARYSDTMRHSWGCAIDINPVENYYINYANGSTVGSFCWKTGSSAYCITPESSVVKAFAKYGWGWGGQGWTSSADYMHFSILASGG